MNKIKRLLTLLILRATHRIWNREISRVLGKAYNQRVIDSRELHILCAAFDPTQGHLVYPNKKNDSNLFFN
jgi:hypothetical protein